MGVTYKLKPEVIKYLLELKQAEPKISCRKAAALASEKFQLKVGKSSVNGVFKESELSMPVGRRRERRKYERRVGLGHIEVIESSEQVVTLEPENKVVPEAQAQAEAKEIKKIEAEARAKVEAEREVDRKRRESAAKAKAETEAKAKAEAKVQAEAEAKAKAEAEARAKAEAEAKAKEEAERKAKEEAEAKAKEEVKERAREAAEAQAKAEAEEKSRQEAEAKAAAEIKAKAEAEERASKETAAKAREEEIAKFEAELKAKADEIARIRLESKPEAIVKAQAEDQAKTMGEANLQAQTKAEKAQEETQEQDRKKAEAKAERAKEEAEAKAEVERKAKEEAEAKAKAEDERKVKEEAETRAKAEAEDKAKAEAEKVNALAEAEQKAAEALRPEVTAAGLGAIFLEAADYLSGGSYYITQAIKYRLTWEDNDLLAKTKAHIYSGLFGNTPDIYAGLSVLTGKKILPEAASAHLKELQAVSALPSDISRIVSTIFQEVRCIKVSLLDGTEFYMDGQLRTVWSIPQIPYSFSATTYNIKNYIYKYFQQNKPIILFAVPESEIPVKEFFNLMSSMESQKNRVSKLTLYGPKLGELETVRVRESFKRHFVFGLWPWQFSQYRTVKSIGPFQPYYFEPLEENFYIAEAEIELWQPEINQRITLRGCAMKRKPGEKIRFVILSNFSGREFNLVELVNLYLSRWPNLEEGLEDFRRKIELFTYTGSSQSVVSASSLVLDREAAGDINRIFEYYLNALDLYVRQQFLPIGLEGKSIGTMKEQLYSLPGTLKRRKDSFLMTLQPPPEAPYAQALKYACRRVNESDIRLYDDKRLWLST
ncbi:cell envelope integrity protein TolA [Candidatus Omnitrophota bacterium]